MSHTKHVFVVNNANGTGMQTTEDSLGANDLGVYENDSFQQTIAALVAGDTFQLANSQYSSPRFNFSDVVKVSDVDGTTGTSQVIQATVVVEADGTAEIKLINVTDGREKFAIATFETQGHTVNAAGNNAAASALATLIGASKRDVFKDVQAAVDGSTANQVNITIPKNVVMRAASNDNSSTSITTQPILSIGTVADVNAEFEDGLPFLGVTNIAGPNVVKPASNASGLYDRVCIQVKTDQVAHGRTDLHDIVIYIVSDNNEIIDNLETLFGYTTSTTQT